MQLKSINGKTVEKNYATHIKDRAPARLIERELMGPDGCYGYATPNGRCRMVHTVWCAQCGEVLDQWDLYPEYEV